MATSEARKWFVFNSYHISAAKGYALPNGWWHFQIDHGPHDLDIQEGHMSKEGWEMLEDEEQALAKHTARVDAEIERLKAYQTFIKQAGYTVPQTTRGFQ